ncbi:MAG: exodeoxyribonuclease VII small subunit [Lachnospiraceae bacterium]|nr:exodeoxyribonuclease VII small subunit [Lachnospiraceae bacterium]
MAAKAAKKEDAKFDFSALSIEDGLKELDEITAKMQDPNIPLEEAFALYEKGTALLSYVNGKVESVEAKVRVLKGDGTTEPFGDYDKGESGSGSGEGDDSGADPHGFYGDDELPFA